MEPATIRERAILIRLTPRVERGPQTPELYSPSELYEATRSAWTVGPNREQAEYAFAVYRLRVLAVYSIAHWLLTDLTDRRGVPRYEFEGRIDNDRTEKYRGKSVRTYFTPGASNPYTFVNIP